MLKIVAILKTTENTIFTHFLFHLGLATLFLPVFNFDWRWRESFFAIFKFDWRCNIMLFYSSFF